MNQTVRNIGLVARMAQVVRALPPPAGDNSAGLIDICWTTGATVQRYRWEGWEDLVEYDEELVVDAGSIRLDRLNMGGPFLDSHRSWGGIESVLGSVVPGSVKIANGEGTAQVRLTTAPGSSDAVHKIMEGTIRFVSVGYNVHKYEITKEDGKREHWRAVDWEPYEVSAVAMPADAGAAIRGDDPTERRLSTPCLIVRQGQTAAPSASNEGNQMSKPNLAGGATDETRTAAEIAAADAAAAAAATLAAQRNAPNPPAGTTATESEIRATALRDSQTVADLCVRHDIPVTFGADLLAKGSTIDAIRGAILDKIAERDTVGAGRGGSPTFANARGQSTNEQAYADGVENAVLHRADPKVHALTEQGRQFRGMTLMEMARDSLERRGVNTRGMNKMELAGAALIRAGGMHSTSDFPYLLANVANKTLRAAYESTPRTFTAWARQTSIPDFKSVQRTQLGGAPDLLRVPESGEFSYGTIGEGKETYALTTYGRIIGITRQTLINDDLEAFTRIPSAFGASAADLESDVVYGLLATNGNMNDGNALFSSAHANLGTAAVIDETSLAEIYRLFGNMRGIEGRQISIQPKFIITPPGTRSVQARKNVTAVTPNAVSGVNAFAGYLTPIEEPRLIPAAGADPWYVIADSSRIDTIEYAYLDGATGIFTETRNGFEVDGIEIKARHDFAAAPIDWRGMVKNAGV